MTNATVQIIDDKTPVRNTARILVLDPTKPAIDNFLSITHYIQNLPVNTKVEMLMTLQAFSKAELSGSPVYMSR